MNQDNLLVFTQALRTTTLPQGTGALHQAPQPEQTDDFGDYIEPDGEPGYCCLGIGCLAAGIPEEDGGVFARSTDSAPTAFIDWLGVPYGRRDTNLDTGEWDLVIDWPEGVWTDERGRPYNDDREVRTATGLNDHLRLPFEQIADVLDYFGIKEAV